MKTKIRRTVKYLDIIIPLINNSEEINKKERLVSVKSNYFTHLTSIIKKDGLEQCLVKLNKSVLKILLKNLMKTMYIEIYFRKLSSVAE
jgi:hypothetical protein